MALTTYLANHIFDKMFRNQTFTPPSTLYLALFTSAPTDAYTSGSPNGTEVSGSGYSRQAMALDAAASRATQNTDVESFTASGGNFGTVVAIGIFDASTNGNLLWWDGLDVSKTVNDGDTISFAAGAIDLAFAASP